jgi:hypothetical protein
MKMPIRLAAASEDNYEGTGTALKPIIVRLENILATGLNRKHIQDRLRELNRTLEETGTPFHIRLLE